MKVKLQFREVLGAMRPARFEQAHEDTGLSWVGRSARFVLDDSTPASPAGAWPYAKVENAKPTNPPGRAESARTPNSAALRSLSLGDWGDLTPAHGL